MLVRNQAAHAGELSDDLRQTVHAFGTAAIQNFVTCADKWFGLPVRMPYLLPVGFLTDEGPAQTAGNATQRLLLRRLQELAATRVNDDSEFAITLHLDVRLNPDLSGGGVDRGHCGSQRAQGPTNGREVAGEVLRDL